MHISLSYNKFATAQSGGARESLLTLLEGVARQREITVDVFQTPPVDDPPNLDFDYEIHSTEIIDVPTFTWVNQIVNRYQWGRFLKAEIDSGTDLLMTQNRYGPVSVKVADKFGIPSLFFIRSLALTGYENYRADRDHVSNWIHSDLGGKLQYPFLSMNFRDYGRAVSSANHTITNSMFTASMIEELYGIESTVIYPPIRLDQYRVDYTSDGYITMVNPRAEYKGVDIFLDIADQLPEEDFLLVGSIHSERIRCRVKRTPNVRHLSWCEDMREAYSMAKLVIVPSRYEEPFGRVAAEAMVSGIPCVVSDKGGLPEVVGETGVVVSEIESTGTWISAIHTALEHTDAEAQKERVKMFSAERQVNRLVDLLEDVI